MYYKCPLCRTKPSSSPNNSHSVCKECYTNWQKEVSQNIKNCNFMLEALKHDKHGCLGKDVYWYEETPS